MIKCFITGVLLLTANVINAQGIQFEQNETWSQIQAKAKAENKVIFMDCYATWCGPCKFMSTTIFPQKDVGEFMNANFINVAVQLDKTPKDADNVRKWYADAKNIADRYQVDELPTFLFFSPDGQLIHRIIGATGTTGEDFVAKAKDALDPQKQAYLLIQNYREHLTDSAYLHNALAAAVSVGHPQAENIGNSYYETVKAPLAKDNLKLILDAVGSARDKGFDLYLKYPEIINDDVNIGRGRSTYSGNCVFAHVKEEVDTLFNQNIAILNWSDVSARIKAKYPQITPYTIALLRERFEYNIFNKEIQTVYYRRSSPLINWKSLKKRIITNYPGYQPDSLIAVEKPKYYAYKNMFVESQQAASAYLKKYGHNLTPSQLNDILYDYLFKYAEKKADLERTQEWCAKNLKKVDMKDAIAYYSFLDTYANVKYKLHYLYHIDDITEIVAQEQKAVDGAVNGHDLPHYIDLMKKTLEKMKAGKPTWD